MAKPKDSQGAEILLALFDTAVQAVLPSRCLPTFVPEPISGHTLVVAAGKAAATMAQTFEQHFSGAFEGIAVVPDGHDAVCETLEVVTASHPVPDSRGVAASRRVLELVGRLGEGDQLVCLLSGGASALLCLPADGLSLERKREITRTLLNAGAPVTDINCVRKHLSAIKGGRLATAASPAATLTLAISDVVGDDPAVIASGPTQADPTSSADAAAILARFGLLQGDVSTWLHDAKSETPKPGDPRLQNCDYRIIASGRTALVAAQKAAERDGLRVDCLGDDLEGDARELAQAHAMRVCEILSTTARPDRPRLLLSGGETTVAVTGAGQGGRNTEYLLALAMSLDGRPGVSALACDTDGIDGRGGHAGALYTPAVREAWLSRAMDPEAYAAENDSAGFFEALGALIATGPTRTNVNDFRALLLLPEAWPD